MVRACSSYTEGHDSAVGDSDTRACVLKFTFFVSKFTKSRFHGTVTACVNTYLFYHGKREYTISL